MPKKKTNVNNSPKNTLGMAEEEYNNYLAVTSKAQAKIQAHKDAIAAKEIAVAKLAKLGITEADLKAMGL